MYNCGTLEIYNVLYLIGVLLSIFCLKLEFKCKDLFQITIKLTYRAGIGFSLYLILSHS